MRFWVGVTDNGWFEYLAAAPGIDEVNFWHPGGQAPFTHLPEGTPFLFKLKAPHHHIAGGGFFVKYESLPLPLAWDAFGEKNGAPTYARLQALIGPLRRRDDGRTPEIGCSILAEPFFWPRSEWIPVADTFARNIVKGRTYDTADPEDASVWAEVEARLARMPAGPKLVAETPMTFGAARPIRPRLGQGAFRALVTNAYQRRCAVTGEHTLPVLEAAHIRPVGQAGPNNTYNGLLLRSDFHRLFDLGLVTVTPEYRVEVSGRIREEWFNGRMYYRLHGERLASIPARPEDRPRPDLLAWHNEHVFERTA